MKLIKLFALVSVMLSCNSEFTAKEKGYFKISFPDKKYQKFERVGYPYTFEYPTYASITKDSSFFGEATENPWWININFPEFRGTIHLSYKEIGKNKLDKLISDAFEMTNKHNVKAFEIRDSLIHTPNNIYGMYFNVGGNVATANQFFLTDSVKHFFRGALYFDATPNTDSLQIVNTFLEKDIKHLIQTFKWQ